MELNNIMRNSISLRKCTILPKSVVARKRNKGKGKGAIALRSRANFDYRIGVFQLSQGLKEGHPVLARILCNSVEGDILPRAGNSSPNLVAEEEERPSKNYYV